MTKNLILGDVGIPLKPVGSMDTYDRLPASTRKAFQEAPYNVALSPYERGDMPPSADICREIFTRHIKIMARTTYGPDHPQAQ